MVEVLFKRRSTEGLTNEPIINGAIIFDKDLGYLYFDTAEGRKQVSMPLDTRDQVIGNIEVTGEAKFDGEVSAQRIEAGEVSASSFFGNSINVESIHAANITGGNIRKITDGNELPSTGEEGEIFLLHGSSLPYEFDSANSSIRFLTYNNIFDGGANFKDTINVGELKESPEDGETGVSLDYLGNIHMISEGGASINFYNSNSSTPTLTLSETSLYGGTLINSGNLRNEGTIIAVNGIQGIGEELSLISNINTGYLSIKNNNVKTAAFGSYDGFAFLSNEVANCRIGINSNGVPQFWSTLDSSSAKTLIHTGNANSYTAKKTVWKAPIKTKNWSRLCFVSTADIVGGKFILTINGTRENVVFQDSFIITTHHDKKASIIKIAGSKYLDDSYDLRVLSDYNGNCYIDMNESVKDVTTEITYSINCSLVDLYQTTVTPYTTYTPADTIPDGFSVTAEMKVTSASIQADMPVLTIAQGGTGASDVQSAVRNLELASSSHYIQNSDGTSPSESQFVTMLCNKAVEISTPGIPMMIPYTWHGKNYGWAEIIKHTTWCFYCKIFNPSFGIKNYFTTDSGRTWNEVNISSDSLPTVPVSKGGTGATTALGGQYNLLKDMTESTTAVADADQIVVKYSSPSTTTGVLLYKKASALSTYVNSKLPTGSTSAKGILKVGSNLTVSSGTLSLSKANVTAALGYTPPNMTFGSGSGYLILGAYKICWGTLTAKYAATSSAQGHYNGDSTSVTGGTFASAFSAAPTVVLSGGDATVGILNVEPKTVTTSGITAIRFHRSNSYTDTAGYKINYIAFGKA